MEPILIVAAGMILLGGLIAMCGVAHKRVMVMGIAIAVLLGVVPMAGVALYAPEKIGHRPHRLAVFAESCHAACEECADCQLEEIERGGER